MKTKLLSSHICGSTGKVVAITETGMYLYKDILDDVKTKALIKKLETANEINTDHWTLEWELSKAGS